MADDESEDGDVGNGRDPGEMLAALHDHLKATEELPIDPAANRWIGEAEAVAADLHEDPDPPEAVVRERVGHVRDLLERMGDPDSEAARERVAAALSVVEAIESRVATAGGDDGDDGHDVGDTVGGDGDRVGDEGASDG